MIARIILPLTCILTLAVSNGKVAKSAMQAAVPAVSNLKPSEKSSDVPCFMMRSLFFFSLLLPLKRVVEGVHGMCGTVQDSWISLRLIFPSRDKSAIPRVRSSSSSKGFPFVLERFYVHYIQSPTRGRTGTFRCS